jgi:excisionase family DNA binding protein
MKQQKAQKNTGRGSIPSALSPGAESEVLTVRDAAELLLCHTSTIYRLVEHREVPGFRLGGGWRFRRADIEQWIAAGGVQRSETAPRRGRPPAPAKRDRGRRKRK